MDELFEEVLAICLDRLTDGDSIESCVADYPECPDLRPLLELAEALSVESRSDRERDNRAPTWLQPRADMIRLRPTG